MWSDCLLGHCINSSSGKASKSKICLPRSFLLVIQIVHGSEKNRLELLNYRYIRFINTPKENLASIQLAILN